MKARSLAVALFVGAAVLYGGLFAIYMGSIQAALLITLYACVAAACTATILSSWLSRRAASTDGPAGGLLDGAGVTALAYVVGVVLLAGHSAVATPHNGFFGVAVVGLAMSSFFLPPALIFGGLAGLAFRMLVPRSAV